MASKSAMIKEPQLSSKWSASTLRVVLDLPCNSVVFVHGLTGNRENTWTDKGTGVFWPEALLKNDVPEARIITFGYDADVVHFWSMASQNRIGNHAQNLVNVLSQLRERSDTVGIPHAMQ